MARQFDCPKCGADITDTYDEPDYDTGINGGYYCEACDEGFDYEDDGSYENGH